MSGWEKRKENRKGKGKRHTEQGKKERCFREEEEADERTHP